MVAFNNSGTGLSRLARRGIALYDRGATVSHVVDQLLAEAGRQRVEVGMILLKAALAMPNGSAQNTLTPVKAEISQGVIQVGDFIFSIDSSHRVKRFPKSQPLIILLTDRKASCRRRERSPRIECYNLANCVGQMVTFRAVCSRVVVRNWWRSLPDNVSK